MKNVYFLLFLLSSITLSAQLPDWSTAPDFSLPDTEDTQHDLYDYLDDGYSVVLDFSATWCGPCWNYHQNGVLEELYDEYGPGGEDKVMVFMVEADPNTSQPCIYGPSGCSGGSIGDWTAGTSYPILNPDSGDAAQVNADFQINYYPTLYGVAPNGDIYEVGQANFNTWESWVAESFQMHNTSWSQNEEDCTASFIDLHLEGGHGTVQYEWSNGSTSQDLSDIAPGDYFVTLTDDNDYEVVIGPIEIEFNNGGNLELIDLGHITCNGGDEGFIEVEFTEGTGDYEYDWSHGETTAYVDDLTAGDYTVVATDVNTGCEFEMEFEIEEPDELEYELEIFQPDCAGEEPGAIEFFIDGGTWPITFFYEDFDTREEYVELEPGVYNVTIMDFNGCELEAETFEIVAADAPMAYSSATGIFNCQNVSVSVAIDSSSAGPNISYAWFDPSMTYIGSDSLTSVDSSGLYTLQVTNSESGCVTSSTVMVMENYEEPDAVVQTLNNIDCNNNTAILSAQGSSMDSTVTYVWTTVDGSILSDPSLPEIEVSSAGTYSLEVINTISGCMASASTEVLSVDVPELQVDGETSFCEGGATTLCVTPNADESVQWFRDGDLLGNQVCLTVEESLDIQVVLTNSVTGCEAIEAITTSTIELPSADVAGDFEFCAGESAVLCLDDSANAEATWTVDGVIISTTECVTVNTTADLMLTVTSTESLCSNSNMVYIQENALPEVVFNGTTDFCEGESTTICVDNGANASVIWRESGNDVGNGECIVVDYASVFEVVYTDNLTGCSTEASINTQTYDAPEVEVTSSGLLDCTNGVVMLNVEGLGADETVLWLDEDNNVVGSEANIDVTDAGVYTAYVETLEGCSSQTMYEVELDPEDLPMADFAYSADEFSFQFNNLSESFNELVWDFGDGNTSTETDPSHVYTDAGFYTVVLSVTNDCGTSRLEIEVAAYSALQLTTVSSDVSCYGGNDGRISVNVFGGIQPYEYTWSDPLTGIDYPDVDGLSPGFYTVIVSDAVGQMVTQDVIIGESEEIVVTAGVEYNNGAGNITLDVTGGNGIYTYDWSNGSSERDQTDLAPGEYTVVVTDELGCTTTITVVVEDTTSTVDPVFVNNFSIYPNPAVNEVLVKLELDNSRTGQLKIYSLLGERMHMQSYNTRSINASIDVDAWPSGLYIVEFSSADKSAIRKLIVGQ